MFSALKLAKGILTQVHTIRPNGRPGPVEVLSQTEQEMQSAGTGPTMDCSSQLEIDKAI